MSRRRTRTNEVENDQPRTPKRHSGVSDRSSMSSSASFLTPVKRYHENPVENKVALLQLILNLVNPSTTKQDADGRINTTEELIRNYLIQLKSDEEIIDFYSVLLFIQEYTEKLTATIELPDTEAREAVSPVASLFFPCNVIIPSGSGYEFTRRKSDTPVNFDPEEEMVTLYIGLLHMLFTKTSAAIIVIDDHAQQNKVLTQRLKKLSMTRATTDTSPRKKLSRLARIKAKWKALHPGWKIAAGVIITLCIVAIIVAAIVCPPSLVVTLPLAGKVAVGTLIMGGCIALATTTTVGHAVHITRHPINKKNEQVEPLENEAGAEATNNLSDRTKADLTTSIGDTILALAVLETKKIIKAHTDEATRSRQNTRATEIAESPYKAPKRDTPVRRTTGSPDTSLSPASLAPKAMTFTSPRPESRKKEVKQPPVTRTTARYGLS